MLYTTVTEEIEQGHKGKVEFKCSAFFSGLSREQFDRTVPRLAAIKAELDAEASISTLIEWM